MVPLFCSGICATCQPVILAEMRASSSRSSVKMVARVMNCELMRDWCKVWRNNGGPDGEDKDKIKWELVHSWDGGKVISCAVGFIFSPDRRNVLAFVPSNGANGANGASGANDARGPSGRTGKWATGARRAHNNSGYSRRALWQQNR